MLWALLAILGVPIWLVVGVLVGVGLSRRNYQREEGVFAFNVRPEGASTWPRQLAYGRHVRDVLVTNRGAALVRTEFHAVDDVVDLVLDDPPKKPADAVGRLVTIADGSRLEVAVSESDAEHIDALAQTRSSDDERKGTV
jgi:hypothetical protein